ncbi:MAG: hypothetical protein LBT01_04365 [Spirochaetaceae bacterium]|jgi:putative heme iron utilization protein|nr:hypothetical protein [Spirochaetaceae bacterium]
MDEQQILNHLFDLEKNAAAIVDEANTEANKRINDHETACRNAYESQYAKEYAALEDAYKGQIAALDADYQQKLDDYKGSLQGAALDKAAFFTLAKKLLCEASLPAGG